MKLETFFEKFDQFADAPNAVAKMRELILQLAMQGKLVEREVREGDGHSLLKRLRKLPPEKNSKSRVPRDLTAEPEIELGVPVHWAITTVENTTRATGFFCDGDWIESKDQNPDGDVRLIQLADVGDGQYRDRSSRFMTKEAAARLNCSYLTPGDILIARMPDPLGRCCRFPGDSKPAVTVVDICILRPNDEFFDSDFLVIAINNPEFRRLVANQATGTTRSRISRSNLSTLPVPLPPLAEQKRIVAKVDELMALCDRLETQQQERDTRHAALAHASLSRFADAPTPANLNHLFHPSYAIAPADLRRTILSLAVQGKLVQQDANDEDVELLLARNDEQRRETAKNDRRADANTLSLLSAEDRWEIADTWLWQPLANLVLFIDYRGKTPIKLSHGIRLLTAKNVRKGEINLSPEEYLSEQDYHDWMTRGFPKAGDVLFTTEAPMGNAAVVELTERFALAQRVICFRNYGALDPSFLIIQILSDKFQFILDKNGTGVTAKGIKAAKLKQLPIAVPPLAEQRRIVAKVDQLMTLVDQLETQLATSRAAAINLMEAVVAELTVSEQAVA
jgi:type I restriction enzyme S subunit